MKRFLGRKIPLYFFLIATGLLSVIIFHLNETATVAKMEIQQTAQSVWLPARMIQQVRLQDYQLIKPLVLSENEKESEELIELKRALSLEIYQLKLNGIIDDASVYVKRMNDGEWISVNNTLLFSPGSMIKIAAMITYLKMGELNPELMDRKFLYQGPTRGMPLQTFNDSKMIPGTQYSAKELLSRMIVNSDNFATQMINESLDVGMFKKLFTDLGIPEPDVHDMHFTIDILNVSKFLSVLYNATYLNKENSEYGMSLLSQSTFSKGITNGLPADVKVAHKFGETSNGKEAQLHETAIVYFGNDPYLLTIMTKGNNVQRLPNALSDLSKIAFDKMKIAR